MKKLILSMLVLMSSVTSAQATVWTIPITGGEMRFDDWGFTGPNGRGALDFEPVNGFGNNPLDPLGGISQIQHVLTLNPDGLTQDPHFDLYEDLIQTPGAPGTIPNYPNANMDGNVNFYGWGYTTVADSKFDNMMIDFDGDYFIAREDMNFNFYGVLHYTNEDPLSAKVKDDGIWATNIGFQPYALSDARGWCGSILASHPMAVEPMAGQVTFDFGFEAYMPWSPPGYVPGTGSMQIVKDFEMRSYGTLEIETSQALGGAGDFFFEANAVVNNTSPLAPVTGDFTQLTSDADYYNQVSFMGGGVVPGFIWVLVQDSTAPMEASNIIAVLDEDELGNPIVPIDPATGLPMAGDLVHHQNSFAGYPFLLRADGVRILDYYDENVYTNISNVPPSVDGFWASATNSGYVFVFGDFFAEAGTQVFVNGIPAPMVEVANKNLLIFLLPAGDTNGPITVTTAAGSSTSEASFGGISTGLNIDGFWPGTGTTGTIVFLFGSGFDTVAGGNQVQINGVPVPLVHNVSEDMLLFVVPPDATTGPITVTNSSGTIISSGNFVRYP